MNDLLRFAFLRDGASFARCDSPDCSWRESEGKPSTIAGKARKHARETGHRVYVTDTRVTVYRKL